MPPRDVRLPLRGVQPWPSVDREIRMSSNVGNRMTKAA
jgi:hypothetical protein